MLPGSDANQMKPSFLSPNQVQQLRAQIMAYRLLARNQPIPPNITTAAQGRRPDVPPNQPNAGPPMGQQPGYPAGAQGSQPFQRPPAPGTPTGPMQPAGPRMPGYPGQQQLTTMGPPSAAGTPAPNTTSSPVPGTIPTPRPPQPQVIIAL